MVPWYSNSRDQEGSYSLYSIGKSDMTNRRRKGGRDSGRESGGADSGSCDGDSTNGGINRVHSISNRGSAKRRGSRAAFTYMVSNVGYNTHSFRSKLLE